MKINFENRLSTKEIVVYFNTKDLKKQIGRYVSNQSIIHLHKPKIYVFTY